MKIQKPTRKNKYMRKRSKRGLRRNFSTHILHTARHLLCILETLSRHSPDTRCMLSTLSLLTLHTKKECRVCQISWCLIKDAKFHGVPGKDARSHGVSKRMPYQISSAANPWFVFKKGPGLGRAQLNPIELGQQLAQQRGRRMRPLWFASIFYHEPKPLLARRERERERESV